MRRYGFSLVVTLVAGLLSVGFAHRVEALNHVKALRSGGLVVVIPETLMLALPASEEGGVVRPGADIMPQLLRSPSSLSGEKTYWDTMDALLPPAKSTVLKPHANSIRTFPAEQILLPLGKQAAAQVPWLKQGSRTRLSRGRKPINAKAMLALTFSSGQDAEVFVRPAVVFSSGFKRVYLIIRVMVYGRGPVHAFFMGSKTFYTSLALNETTPQLSGYGYEGIASGGQDSVTAARVRANVWFADNASRLKQALAQAVEKTQKPLVAYLDGRS